jgi:GTP 3',8-cyclase
VAHPNPPDRHFTVSTGRNEEGHRLPSSGEGLPPPQLESESLAQPTTAPEIATLAADDLLATLRSMTTQERVEIEVIHRSLGRHHVGQYGACPQRPTCPEGFWALRLDHAAGLMPCLLRDDLRLDLRPALDHADPLSAVTDAVAHHVAAFTEGTL